MMMKEIDEEKKQRVRELYLKSGLSYTQLSNLLGINRSTLARWLNGSRTPADETMEYIEKKVNDYVSQLQKK